MKLYALVTKQGTACAEAALCETHLEAHRDRIAERTKLLVYPPSDQPTTKWEECSENDAIACDICGAKGGGDGKAG